MAAPHPHRRLRDMFDAVAALPEPQRAAALHELSVSEPEIAERVGDLLRADRELAIEPLFLLEPPEEMDARPAEPFLSEGRALRTPMGEVTVGRMLSAPARVGHTEVYRAHHPDAGEVAVKLLRDLGRGSPDRRRFIAEVQALRTLRHPNIAELLCAGLLESPGQGQHLGIITRFIPGQPLDVWARERSLAECAGAVEAIARAIHAVHQRAILHRDVKPSNIVVDERGRPFLLDLGVAKFVGDGHDEFASMGGTVAGTLHYMAPEQLTPTTTLVDVRSDVYALGVILYELVAGGPFLELSGLSEAEALERKRAHAPALPKGISQRNLLLQVALAATRPDPGQRYASAAAMADDLARALEGRPITVRRTGVVRRTLLMARRRPLPAAAGVLAAVAVLAGAGVYAASQAEVARARARAEARFDDTRHFARWVIFDLTDRLGAIPGTSETRSVLIEEASRTLDVLAADPVADDELLLELAEAYIRLGDVLHAELGSDQRAQEAFVQARRVLARCRDPAAPQARLLDLRAEVGVAVAGNDVGVEAAMQALYERVLGEMNALPAPVNESGQFFEWRATLQWLHARLLVRDESMGERALALCRAARADADRAAALRPRDPIALAAPARARYWLAHTAMDLHTAGTTEMVADALRAAEALAADGHPHGDLHLSRAKLLWARWRRIDGDPQPLLALGPEIVRLADAASAREPANRMLFRNAESCRALLATDHLLLARDGGPADLDLAEKWVREAQDRFRTREARGWATADELSRYPASFEWLAQLIESQRAASSSGDGG